MKQYNNSYSWKCKGPDCIEEGCQTTDRLDERAEKKEIPGEKEGDEPKVEMIQRPHQGLPGEISLYCGNCSFELCMACTRFQIHKDLLKRQADMIKENEE